MQDDTFSFEVSASASSASTPEVNVDADVASDAAVTKLRDDLAETRRRYREAQRTIASLQAMRHAQQEMGALRGARLPAATKSGSRPEVTVILAMSDWHIDEIVNPEEVRGLNEYSLEVADERIAAVTDGARKMIEFEQANVAVRRIVVWLGGDFISGHIHPELVESTSLPPIRACVWAGQRIRGMLDALNAIGPPVTVVTSTGNHGRTTSERRIAGENNHSFEQQMYYSLAANPGSEKWMISEGYHSLVDIDGFHVRFHHGHALRGGGGFGGIVPGANKIIAGWNASQSVDLDIFGHLHTFTPMRRFVCNGSLIGPSPYSDRLGCAHETPCQAMVAICHEHNRVTKAIPIFAD